MQSCVVKEVASFGIFSRILASLSPVQKFVFIRVYSWFPRFFEASLVLTCFLAFPSHASLLSSNLFPADNPWNQNISQAPVATNSHAIITRIGNGRFHPDFGQDYRNGSSLYGIPYNVVHGTSTAKTHIVIDAYANQSDIHDVPLPSSPVIEGDMDNAPTVGLNA